MSGFYQQGYTCARVDGQWIELAAAGKLSKRKDHFIDLLVDRLTVDSHFISRLKESLQKSVDLTEGQIKIELINSVKSVKGLVKNFSIHATCPVCLTGFPELEPKLFSFNNPKGACRECYGLGYLSEEEGVVEIKEPAALFEKGSRTQEREGRRKRPAAQQNKEPEETGASIKICSSCKGTRLQPFALSVKIKNKNIAGLSSFSIEELSSFCSHLKFPPQHKIVADKILQKIKTDLNFLKKMGLGYLSLDRPVRTLSGGRRKESD